VPFGSLKRSLGSVCALLMLVLGLATASHGAPNTRPPAPSTTEAPDTGIDRAPLNSLGPGDSVQITVYGQPDMNATVDVGEDGTIPVNLAGSVKVAGLSPKQAAAAIEQALISGGYFRKPQVTVTVGQARSRKVSVIGEVGSPGRYPIESNTTLVDLLALAGGLKETASQLIYLLRTDEDGTVSRFPVDTTVLNNPLAAVPNQSLKSGDQILVPRSEQYYLYGEVKQPNRYRLEPGLTLLEAIIRAGGLTPRGSNTRIELRRKDKDGRVITRKMKPDEELQAGDMIRVKESIF
jgi:polysaccharide export outer membrane protein